MVLRGCFCLYAQHCKLQSGFHAQFCVILGRKANETRTRSHDLRMRSGNRQHTHLATDKRSKASKASKASKYRTRKMLNEGCNWLQSLCIRDHLRKQCFFHQTLKISCILNTLYIYIYIFIYIMILYIYIYVYVCIYVYKKHILSKTEKYTSLTAFPQLNASWSDLPFSFSQANSYICDDRVRLPTVEVADRRADSMVEMNCT